jgi:sortase A
MRRALRALSTVLIVAGSLLLVDAVLTVTWQEPVSALYARINQGALAGDLEALREGGPTAGELRALASLGDGDGEEGQRRRLRYLARSLKRRLDEGDAAGRVRIPRIGADHVIVDGTGSEPLRRGPGLFEDQPWPGAGGTAAIAGHRTTYGAPFRDVDRLRRGDAIVVEMPYGRFEYAVERTRIVEPTDLSVLRRVSFDRLVLTACHPLYSAEQRIVVFARLRRAEPTGGAASNSGPGQEA